MPLNFCVVSTTSSWDVSDPRTDPGVRVRGPRVGSLTSRLLSCACHLRGEGRRAGGPLLSVAIQAGTDLVQGRRVLLIDDLWETGSTLRRVAEVLGKMGATEVRALAMTRTK
jgi:orotate phosphoribosyltransferase